ncbi:hypothetical protein GL213_03470 [Halogeometricum borinquense]|uniref:hypothetical protein n=1 Tax=Halogeometricum borinquense TaxID=60847 RepID=UPI0011816A98|nr:hypothetical protein [Halogeometricum borinquense]QIQ75668.1 hypothetical protein GL213_03470 [Halogeometricum borinquense]
MNEHLESIKDPEYTGKNRCTPCTLLNISITITISAVLWFVGPLIAILFAVLGAARVWQKGYLVPKTPGLTKKYLPTSFLRRFHSGAIVSDDSTARSGGTMGSPSASFEDLLTEHDVVEPCSDSADLCLTAEAEQLWRDTLSNTNELSSELLRKLYPIVEGEYQVSNTGGTVYVTTGDTVIAHWISESAMLADLTGASVLERLLPMWNDIPKDQKGQLLISLRPFVPQCPRSGEAVEVSEKIVESCCSYSRELVLKCTISGDIICRITT